MHTRRNSPGSDCPLISIIIVVFQDCRELQSVLESVLPQRSNQVEVIVIDGGSHDGTLEFLQEHDSEIDYWLSEPDRGLYDAMNKGIAVARGRFICHINAGDRLLNLPISELLRADAENADIVSFNVLLDGKRNYRPRIGLRLRINNTLHHQGTFYRRSSFPGYNLKYKVFADFDVNQRLARRGALIRLSDTVVAWHNTAGVSHQNRGAIELYQVVASNYGIPYVPFSWLDQTWQALKCRVKRLTKSM